MKKQIYFFFFILFFCSVSASAQERYGISNSMYSGLTGNWLNPAFMAASPFIWDFNLVTIHSYADNNYAYLYQTNIPGLIADKGKTTIVVDNAWQKYRGEYSQFMLENKESNSWRKNVYTSVLLQGPSIMFNVKKWTFALETAGRAAVSVTGVHKTVAKLGYEGITYNPLMDIDINVPKFRVNAMAWYEVGVSAAREIIKNRDLHVKAGITLKQISAFGGAYFLNKKMTFYIPNDSDIYFKNVNAKYGYALDENNPQQSQGKGKSMDAGITIEKKTISNSYKCPNFCNKQLDLQYAWKLGVSLVDIGFVRFKKKAQTFLIDNQHNYWTDFTKMDANSIGGFDTTLSQHFSNDTNAVPNVEKTKFTMLLPWAASIQFDYNIGYNVFINGTWVQRIPHFGLPGIDRVNSIAITPRYELRRFGVAMPIVFYQYLWPRIGLAFRLNNFLIIGTDKLGAFVGHRVSGEDIYFALKFNVLKKCKKKKAMPSFLSDLTFMNQNKN